MNRRLLALAVAALAVSVLAPAAPAAQPTTAAPSPISVANALPTVDPNQPNYDSTECRAAPRSGVLPDDATCLSVVDVDLDGDRQRDRLLFFRTSGAAPAAPPDCGLGCAGGHLAPNRRDARVARAILATGVQSDNLTWPSAFEPSALPADISRFGPHRVYDLDGDGSDEVLVIVAVGNVRALHVLTVASGRLQLVPARGPSGTAPLIVNVRYPAGASGNGYRCRDTTGDGRPELQLVHWTNSNAAATAWTWTEEAFRWEGKVVVHGEVRRGTIAGAWTRDERTADFMGDPTEPCGALGTSRCNNVVFAPASENAAFNVVARGITCGEAETFVRRVAEPLGNTDRTPRTEAEGWVCVLTSFGRDAVLPSASYECTNGSRGITFDRG